MAVDNTMTLSWALQDCVNVLQKGWSEDTYDSAW